MEKIELLAPVGGLKHFFAAVENGADAVYMGGTKYNARMNADNFSMEDLEAAVRYAHIRNVKIYITVNTLIPYSMFEAAAKYCVTLYDIGVDAVIVQDLGLASWVKKNLPDLHLHLSTQGTIYNLSGVQAAESLGFSRVVLARETALKDVKKITDSSKMEIEVFVHGALCMCYSGQCQMSRIVGGENHRSANRGLCAQPCRLPYKTKNDDEQYLLSPKDLCTVDYLDEMIDAGITSLKIEGRMKSPEYVAIVTSIYRKYLDEYIKSGEYLVSKEDREALRQIYSRGEFTTGYLFENPEDEILTVDLPKHQGVYVGKVAGIPNKKNLIDVKLTEPLSIGDGIEIRNKSLTGGYVSYLEDLRNNIFRIGDIKGPVEKGHSIYRVWQASLLNDTRKTYDSANFVDGKNCKKVKIDFELSLDVGEHPILKIIEDGKDFVFVDNETVVESAINKPLEKALAEKQLRKTGSTCFEVVDVSLYLGEGSTLPLSALNKLRRDALAAYSDVKAIVKRNAINPDYTFSSSESCEEKCEKTLAFYIYETAQIATYDFKCKMDMLGVNDARLYLPLQEFMQGIKLPEYLHAIPYISNISKGNLDNYIENNFEEIVKAISDCGIAIGNISWVNEFVSAGVKVFSDYGLNLFNEQAKKVANDLGISIASMSLEAQEEGCWPVMITEHPLSAKSFTDRKGQDYHVIKSASEDKWMLFKANSILADNTLISQWKNAVGEYRIYYPSNPNI